jgi:hypothetical protein
MIILKVTFEGHLRNLAGDLIDAVEDTITIEVKNDDVYVIQAEIEAQYGQEFGSFYLNGVEYLDDRS